MRGYAVIDVETTGLYPGCQDRIVEIAVVSLACNGQVTGEWSTLVNPHRDVGPTHIHGIKASDVYSAPSFDEIAGSVIQLLMRLAKQYLPHSGRSLSACCSSAEIKLSNAHSALGDARATGHLFARYLSTAGLPPPWAALDAHASADHWPAATDRCDVHQLRREDAFVPGEGAWLERLINRLPQASEAQDADEYFAMLDRALLDRYLSLSEQDSLVELAAELQLGPDDVRSLNEDYLTVLVEEALADGVLTAEERDDLLHIARMLGLDDAMVEKILTQGIGHRPRRACHHRKLRLRPGDLVALTGDMELPRADWVECAHRAGLRVGTLTRKTKVLVAADPDSSQEKPVKPGRMASRSSLKGPLPRWLPRATEIVGTAICPLLSRERQRRGPYSPPPSIGAEWREHSSSFRRRQAVHEFRRVSVGHRRDGPNWPGLRRCGQASVAMSSTVRSSRYRR